MCYCWDYYSWPYRRTYDAGFTDGVVTGFLFIAIPFAIVGIIVGHYVH